MSIVYNFKAIRAASRDESFEGGFQPPPSLRVNYLELRPGGYLGFVYCQSCKKLNEENTRYAHKACWNKATQFEQDIWIVNLVSAERRHSGKPPSP